MIAANGRLYGTTQDAVFEMTPSGAEKVLYRFKGGPDGSDAVGLAYMNGTLYGVAKLGGTVVNYATHGVVFSVSESGVERVIYAFKGGTDAGYPTGVAALNGVLYVTAGGGKYGYGAIAAVTTAGRESVLHSFNVFTDGAYPSALIPIDGTLYGACSGGPVANLNQTGSGALFSLTPAGAFKSLYVFKGVKSGDGAQPNGLAYANGRIYGTTSNGGLSSTAYPNGFGTVFEATLTGRERVYHAFEGASDGATPSGLTTVSGVVYGTTSGYESGATNRIPYGHDFGTIFSFGGGTEHVLHTFGGNGDGFAPSNLAYLDGELYGVAGALGAYGFGDVFAIGTTGQGFRVAHAFAGGPDGAYPGTGLIVAGGALYGTTFRGGLANDGTVFKVAPDGTERPIYWFPGATGGAAPSSLISAGGTFYGTTIQGGEAGSGTVFTVGPTGQGRTLKAFAEFDAVGEYPYGLTALGGALYGTNAEANGNPFSGSVFATSTTGVTHGIYDFRGGQDGTVAADGGSPVAGLLAVGDFFYGTTENGGSTSSNDPNGYGTVFALSPAGAERVLYRFRGGQDGQSPMSALVELGGTFYGTTAGGGDANGDGTVFAITPAGTERVVYRFKGGADGANPYATLVAVNGVLYGTTSAGGSASCGCGTIFAVTPAGAERVLHQFAGSYSGIYGAIYSATGPTTPLTSFNGLLYGTTSGGGAYGIGSIYAISP